VLLGVTVSSHLSVSEHVSSVIGRCAQTIHAFRIHRSQGLYREAVHCVYSSIIIGKLLYCVVHGGVLPPQLIANACWHSYNVASIVAYAPQKHLTSQNWQNLLMTQYSNASCTTRTVSCTTSSLNCANLYITSDQDITVGN